MQSSQWPNYKNYIQSQFADFSARTFFNFEPECQGSSAERLALITVCKRPELRPLLHDIRFCITELDDLPFMVKKDKKIILDKKILQYPSLAAFHLRHALELITLQTNLPSADQINNTLAYAIAACHSAYSYLNGMIQQERIIAWKNIPEWMKLFPTQTDIVLEQDKLTDMVVARYHQFLRLQDQTHPVDAVLSTGLANRLLPLAYPCEQILADGGDTRLLVDKDTGLNTYGCSPRPRPWAITFSSCTASSISEIAYQEAELLRQSLLLDAWNNNLIERCARELNSIRENIASTLHIEVPGTEIILTPSGTDCELYALYFAMGKDQQKITNILISSTEIGSGTIHAAGGRHFDNSAPLGLQVTPRDPLEGFNCERVNVSVLELRYNSGDLLATDELDTTTGSLVHAAIERGERVLIHLLDCSKTGIGGPGLTTVCELQNQYPSLVYVVVDAAQMRVGRDALNRYLQAGFMVLITGSKFFTGAPFSGAMLVPPHISGTVSSLKPLPAGFAAYSTKMDLPSIWQGITSELSNTPNISLLLRWQAAIWEMKAFFSVDNRNRYLTIRTFGKGIFRFIDSNPDVELVMAPPHYREQREGEECWDQLPSIFTFLVYRNHTTGQRPLSYDEARLAYHCLNTDITCFLPVQASDRENELARKRCHIGQPVRICLENGQWTGALRIAAGARLVSGVEFDDDLGDCAEKRLETEIQTAGVIFRKLSVIVKYWDYLLDCDLGNAATHPPGKYFF